MALQREEQWERSDRLRDFWEVINTHDHDAPFGRLLSKPELLDFSSLESGFMGIPMLKKPSDDVLLEELTYVSPINEKLTPPVLKFFSGTNNG